jgi:glycerate 2-kinase
VTPYVESSHSIGLRKESAIKGRRAPFSDALERLFREALESADPVRAVRRALEGGLVARSVRPSREGRVAIFAAGKAAAGMFDAAAQAFPQASGLVVLPASYRPPAAAAEVLFASHPEPDSSSVRAARRALRFFSAFSRDDVLLCLVSGGTSSLLCLPRPGLSLKEKRDAVRKVARAGASIAALNRLRTRLSAVKGGRLANATRARIVTLVLSDVPGDDVRLVGSGPTIRRGLPRRGDVTRLVGSNGAGLSAAAAAARRMGLSPVVLRRRLQGEAREEGRRLAQRALALARGDVLLAGGETTVALGDRFGRGGRNLELALGAALELERRLPGAARFVRLLATGSDGVDGTSGAAGAIADASTARRARARAHDPEDALRAHDTAALFEALGDRVVTGPTGTNVGDWVFAIMGGRT